MGYLKFPDLPEAYLVGARVAEAKDAGVVLARSLGIQEVLATYSRETILLVDIQEAKIPPMPTCYLIKKQEFGLENIGISLP